MKSRLLRFISTGIFLVFLAGSFAGKGNAAFVGDIPTGLLELENYNYPVYLYVPETYKPGKNYPLVYVLPGEKETPEKLVQEWSNLAKRKSCIVIVPTLKMNRIDVPYETDKWLMRIKADVMKRYGVAPDRIFLVGSGTSGHYAAYLGLKYPTEFSAAALISSAWTGPYEKVMFSLRDPKNQLPFFAAIPEADEQGWKDTEAAAYELTQKGYPVFLEKIPAKTDVTAVDFKVHVFEWLEEKSREWANVLATEKQTMKAKIKAGIREFFIPSK